MEIAGYYGNILSTRGASVANRTPPEWTPQAKRRRKPAGSCPGRRPGITIRLRTRRALTDRAGKLADTARWTPRRCDQRAPRTQRLEPEFSNRERRHERITKVVEQRAKTTRSSRLENSSSPASPKSSQDRRKSRETAAANHRCLETMRPASDRAAPRLSVRTDGIPSPLPIARREKLANHSVSGRRSVS